MGPANAGLEHRPEPTADLLCYQVFQLRPTDQIQFGLYAGNFSFPFIPLNWCRISGDLDRLDMTLADAANAQQQAFLVKRMFVVSSVAYLARLFSLLITGILLRL